MYYYNFSLQDKRLEKVALLHNKDRLHFSLVADDQDAYCQVASGESFQESELLTPPSYRVEVRFNGGMFGSFSQWVVFDFGMRPVLVHKINVELGTVFVQEKVKKLREKLKFDRLVNRGLVCKICKN